MFDYRDYNVYLACGKTDMRKSINGLCEIVQHQFRLDPMQKAVFGFCNRERNRIKLLVWEDNGFWIHLKRFEKGHFVWPEIVEEESTMDISMEDFEHLIKAPGIKQKIKRQEVWKKSSNSLDHTSKM